ncbi:hypothetical protein CR513_17768, partial [Mucuna pruriens]
MTAPSHQYHTRSRTRHMEQVINDLEQQNMEMRAKMGQMREQISKMLEYNHRWTGYRGTRTSRGKSSSTPTHASNGEPTSTHLSHRSQMGYT